MKVRQFIVAEGLLQAVVNYLVTKPYLEVAQLVDELQRVPELPHQARHDPVDAPPEEGF